MRLTAPESFHQAHTRLIPVLRPSTLVGLLLFTCLASGALVSQQRPRPIRFARGATSAQLSGSLVRGETHRYSLTARATQQMRVRVRSAENNVVFQLYPPGSQRALPGAGEGADARTWSGALPATGDYVLVVGSTRGNASYTLEVGIR